MKTWHVMVVGMALWAVALAQPVPTPARWTISVSYPAAEYAEVVLIWERATNLTGVLRWEPFVITTVTDPKSTTNMAALYRVGEMWKSNAPPWFNEWLTNRPKIVYVTNTVIVRTISSTVKALPSVQTKGATR